MKTKERRVSAAVDENQVGYVLFLPLENKTKYPFKLVAQMAKNLPAMQETQIQPLGWEDPLERK